MSTRIIQRYIIREVATPMAISLVVFTFVLLMGRLLKLVELVIDKGVPFSEIFMLFITLFPSFLVITLPLSFLLGVLLGFGRLSSENETIAMRASGISLYTLLKPVLIIAVITALITGILTLVLEPSGKSAFKQQVFSIATSRASAGIEAGVFNRSFDGITLYVREIDSGGGLRDIFIADRRVENETVIINARKGSIQTDGKKQNLILSLEQGSIHRQPEKNQQGYQLASFARYQLSFRFDEEGTEKRRHRKVSELRTGDILNKRKLSEGEDLAELTAELHRRLTLPFAPIVFALAGQPLGIQTHRSGRGGGFAIAIFLFLAYYVLMTLAKTLALELTTLTAFIMWLPTLIFILCGLFLVRQTAREQQGIISKIQEKLTLFWQIIRGEKG